MIKGLILAGGKSSRMGYDKGLIDYHGKPQREFLFDLLKPFCTEVYLSCKKGENIPDHLNPLQDQFEIESPLNGILSAFQKDPFAVWLTVPVDMPFVNGKTLNYLLLKRDPTKVATCFRDSDGDKPEPLLTVWEPGAFPLLKFFYDKGNISPRSFLLQHDVHLVTVPDKNVLVNVNSEEDLKQIKGSG